MVIYIYIFIKYVLKLELENWIISLGLNLPALELQENIEEHFNYACRLIKFVVIFFKALRPGYDQPTGDKPQPPAQENAKVRAKYNFVGSVSIF